MLEAFKDIVADICAFGTHSLRSGRAANATNACVPDRLFKGHGRWSSEFAKDGYVKDSFLTSISNVLGILVFSYVTLFHLFSWPLVGLVRGTVVYGVPLAWGFPPRSK